MKCLTEKNPGEVNSISASSSQVKRLMGLGIIIVTVPGGNHFSGSFTKGEVGNVTNTARTLLLAC